MSARPPRLSFAATRVIRASAKLTADQKLTWLEHYALDNGAAGCYAGAGVVAERLGRTRHMVEVHRRQLVAAGLMVKIQHGTGAADGWFPTLPASCVPRGQRLKADQLSLLADRLDFHLTRQTGGPRRRTVVPDLSTTMYHEGIPPCSPSSDESRTGRHTTVPPESPTVGEVGEAGEDGEVGKAKTGIRDEGDRDDAIEERYGL